MWNIVMNDLPKLKQEIGQILTLAGIDWRKP